MAMADNLFSIYLMIFYLAAIWIGVIIAILKNIKNNAWKRRDSVWKLTFLCYLLLGIGDMCHLGFRLFLNFTGIDPELQLAVFLLGTGYIISGILLTGYYIILFHIWEKIYGKKYSTPSKIKKYLIIIYVTFIIRIILVFLPYNQYFGYDPAFDLGIDFGMITNIPFYIIGIITLVLSLKDSKTEKKQEKPSDIDSKRNKAVYNASIWLIITYICYSLTVYFSAINSLFGMFMLPLTIAYLIAYYYHYRFILNRKIT